MSNPIDRTAALSASLDFEGVDVLPDSFPSTVIDMQPQLAEVLVEATAEPVRFRRVEEMAFARQPAAPASASTPVASAFVPSPASRPAEQVVVDRRPEKTAKVVKAIPRKKVDATHVAAVAVLTVFSIVVALVGAYMRMKPHNAAGLSYVELPQTMFYRDSEVVRVQVTIQSSSEDQDWLLEHRNDLDGELRKHLSHYQPEIFRTAQGITQVQQEIPALINADLQTDKVQAVLLTELLMQNR